MLRKYYFNVNGMFPYSQLSENTRDHFFKRKEIFAHYLAFFFALKAFHNTQLFPTDINSKLQVIHKNTYPIHKIALFFDADQNISTSQACA
jgi:hypothetical protein